MTIEHSGITITADAIKTKLSDIGNGDNVSEDSAFYAKKHDRKLRDSNVTGNEKRLGLSSVNKSDIFILSVI